MWERRENPPMSLKDLLVVVDAGVVCREGEKAVQDS